MSILLPLAIGASVVTGVMAEKNPYDTASQANPYVVAYGGVYNVFNDNKRRNDDQTTVVGGEYRFSSLGYGVRPVIGAQANLDSDAYAYAGLVMEVPLYSDRLWFIPGAAVGAYHHGNGHALGGAIEFRTSAELAYRFNNEHRLGIAIAHLSNAGIYDRNPGQETITVNYSLPLSSVW